MNSLNILIGASSFLGQGLIDSFGSDLVASSRRSEDLCQPNRFQFDVVRDSMDPLEDQIKKHSPSHLFFTVAQSNVDLCAKNRTESNAINIDAPKKCFELLHKYQVIPVFFSSDYVFSGDQEIYTENDTVDPKTIYGLQKVDIENYLQKNFSDFLILRCSKMATYSFDSEKNLLSEPIHKHLAGQALNYFVDQTMTPVFVEDIARFLKMATQKKWTGVFHLNSLPSMSRFELASLVLEFFEIKAEINETQLSDIEFYEPRNRNSCLKSVRKELADFQPTTLQQALSSLKPAIDKML